MLQQAQAALDDDVLEDGSGRDVDGLALGGDDDDGALEGDSAAEVDGARDGEVVELDDLGDAGDALLEVRHLLEVAAELDERRVAEAARAHLQLAVLDRVQIRLDEHQIRARLDGQEAAARHVDAVRVAEVLDGGADGGLELQDADVGLALLVAGDGLAVGDDLHLELVILNDALNGLEVHPDVVGVEVLELLDRLELVDVLLGHLGDFEQAHAALVVDDGAALDVGLGLVGQLHDVLGIGLDHVLEDAEVDDGAEVVGVGEEDDLDTALEELVEDARVVQRLEHVTVAGRVPVVDCRVERLGHREQRVLVDPGVPGLVEGEDVDVVALILLDDGGRVVVRVERVHEENGHVGAVCAVEVLDLADRHVEEGHAIADLDDRLGADATHRGTKATVELQHCQLVEEVDRLRVCQVVVVDHLVHGRRRNAVP